MLRLPQDKGAKQAPPGSATTVWIQNHMQHGPPATSTAPKHMGMVMQTPTPAQSPQRRQWLKVNSVLLLRLLHC